MTREEKALECWPEEMVQKSCIRHLLPKVEHIVCTGNCMRCKSEIYKEA